MEANPNREKNWPRPTNLGRPPAATGQRQSIGAERARCVQSGHALLTLVAAVALAAALAQRSGVALAALLAARSLLAGNAIGAGQARIAAFALRSGLALGALRSRKTKSSHIFTVDLQMLPTNTVTFIPSKPGPPYRVKLVYKYSIRIMYGRYTTIFRINLF